MTSHVFFYKVPKVAEGGRVVTYTQERACIGNNQTEEKIFETIALFLKDKTVTVEGTEYPARYIDGTLVKTNCPCTLSEAQAIYAFCH